MPMSCSVKGCPNLKEVNDCNRSFFSFPKDPYLRKKWETFADENRDWSKLKVTKRICSDHFTADNFDNKLQFDMGFCNKLLISANAVPSIFPESRIPVNRRLKKKPPEPENVEKAKPTKGKNRLIVKSPITPRKRKNKPASSDASDSTTYESISERSQTIIDFKDVSVTKIENDSFQLENSPFPQSDNGLLPHVKDSDFRRADTGLSFPIKGEVAEELAQDPPIPNKCIFIDPNQRNSSNETPKTFADVGIQCILMATPVSNKSCQVSMKPSCRSVGIQSWNAADPISWVPGPGSRKRYPVMMDRRIERFGRKTYKSTKKKKAS